jgi:hypothetical protein
MKKSPLDSYASNVTSQNGEDGVLAEIIYRIGLKTGLCVEFGAWDGKHLSNTWNLWCNLGWKALLIEGDPERFKVLENAVKGVKGVEAVCAYVSTEGKNTLDNLLASNHLQTPDLISIDIDGDDYQIFKALQARAKIIVVEFNPTVPPTIEVVQKEGEYFGASALALLRLAKSKRYALAHVTATNLIFVAEEEFKKLAFEEPDLIDIFDWSHAVFVVTAYDGRTLLSKPLPYKPNLTELDTFVAVNCGVKRHFKNLLQMNPPILLKNKEIQFSTGNELIPVEIFGK